MPFPGAVTHYRAGRAGGVCFVAVRDVDPLQLVESILHEATHALDIAWDGSGVLDELRKKLQESAPPVGRNVLHNVPHTLMFVHAAETVRRNIDPTHKHYGDVAGYYAKVPRATGAVRQPWIEYLDGKLSREDALDHMVQSVSSPTGPQ